MIVPVIAMGRLGRTMTKAQLETWLIGSRDPALSEGANGRRFVLAVLRDLFASDVDVQIWLTTPRAELGGASARELMTTPRVGEVESLVVRLWNQG